MQKRAFWLVAAAVLLISFGRVAPARAQASSTSAVSVGAGIRYICQTSAPAPVSRARLWVRCSDGHLVFTTVSNVDIDVLAITSTQFVTATFSATDSATVTWSNLGGTQSIFVGAPIVTDGGGGVVFWLTGVTSTGATLNASGPWTGTVAVSVSSH